MKTPCWDWVRSEHLNVLVYNCPHCFKRSFFVTGEIYLKIGQELIVMNSHGCPIHRIYYDGENAITEKWKELDLETYKSD